MIASIGKVNTTSPANTIPIRISGRSIRSASTFVIHQHALNANIISLKNTIIDATRRYIRVRLIGSRMKKHDSYRAKIEKNSEEFSAQFKLPFTISCSMGAAEFGPGMSSLQELLAVADKGLYEEKRIKHAAKDSTSVLH